jgi:hypothetical protein
MTTNGKRLMLMFGISGAASLAVNGVACDRQLRSSGEDLIGWLVGAKVLSLDPAVFVFLGRTPR